jgi:hypothetical protein
LVHITPRCSGEIAVKIAFAVFLFVHAAAHGVGFLTVSGLVDIEDASGEPTFLLTRYAQDHLVMRFMSVLWLAALAGFVVAGMGVLSEASWTVTALIAAIAVSLALCVIWVKEVPFGVAANAIVILVLLIPALRDRVVP